MDYELGEFVTPWGVEVEAFHRENTNDWNTLTACLTEDEYKVGSLPQGIRLDGSVLSAIDIGGHVGGATLALLGRGYQVTTVEPLPENMEMIRKSVKRNGWHDRWTGISAAVNANRDSVTISYGDTATVSGAHHEYIGVVGGDGRQTMVAGVTLNDLIESVATVNGWFEGSPFADGMIDFLKIDCEGSEWAAFSTIHPHNLGKVRRIAAELHPTSASVNLRAEFLALLDNQFDDVTDIVYPHTLQYDALHTTNAYYQHK